MQNPFNSVQSQRDKARLLNGVKDADQTPCWGWRIIFSIYPQIDLYTHHGVCYSIKMVQFIVIRNGDTDSGIMGLVKNVMY